MESVALPAVLQGRPRLPRPRPRRLVPLLPDGAGQRAGGERDLRTLRHARHPPRAEPVVPPHHSLRRGVAGLLRPRRLARQDPDDAAQLDRAQPGRRGGLRHLAHGRAGAGAAGLHHPRRHALRRHLHGPRAGAPPGACPDKLAAARGGGSLRGRGPPQVGHRAAVGGPGEDRRPAGELLREPGQRGAGAHPGRRLRRGLVRAGSGHGRPCPRRTGLRLRHEVRPADSRRHRAAELGRRAAEGRLPGPRRAGQLGPVRRHAQRAGHGGHRRPRGAARHGPADDRLSHPGLADFPPALLGHPHPDGPLRGLRHSAGARRGATRAASRGR